MKNDIKGKRHKGRKKGKWGVKKKGKIFCFTNSLEKYIFVVANYTNSNLFWQINIIVMANQHKCYG